MQHIKVKVINKSSFELPKYATKGSVGMDLQANIKENIELKSGERKLISTGIFIQLPEGYEAQIRPRSGLAYKSGIMAVLGTIDEDYIGELKVNLVNLSQENFIIEPAMRIAQLVIASYTKIDWKEVSQLEDTERGVKGFGSTGL